MTTRSKGEGLVLRVGGHPRTEVLKSLCGAGIQLNAHAETLLGHSAFDDPAGRTLRVVERTVEQLGMEKGGLQSQVFAAAR
jgi:hypothetical protein